MALGRSVACYIHKDNTLVALGKDGQTHWMNSTTAVGDFSGKPTGEFIDVAAGHNFCVAIDTDHIPHVWGQDSDYGTDEPTLPGSGTYKACAAQEIAMALLGTDGSVYRFKFGNQSVAFLTDSISASTDYVKIAISIKHGLLLKKDGTVVAWGDDTDGQCTIPALGSGQTYIDIACGERTSILIRRNADGSTVLVRAGYAVDSLPADPTYPITWTAVSAYHTNFMALKSDGTTASWGDEVTWSGGGSSGVNDALDDAKKNNHIAAICCGYSTNAALTRTGGVLAYGENVWGLNTGWHNKCFQDVCGITQSSAPWGGGTVLLKTDGAICLATGAYNTSFVLTPISKKYGKFTQVSGGVEYFLGLRKNGLAYGYGNDSNGQISGLNALLGSGETFTQLVAGNSTTFAIKSDGTIVGCGYNGYLDDENGWISRIPAGTYTKIAVSLQRSAVAINTDGLLVAWWEWTTDVGNDMSEWVDNVGDEEDFNYDLESGETFVDIACGPENFFIALTSAGRVMVFRPTSLAGTIVLPTVNENIIQVAAAATATAVLYANGSVAVQGEGYWSADEDVTAIPTPNRDFIKIAGRAGTFYGVKNAKENFRLVPWGYNYWLECQVGL